MGLRYTSPVASLPDLTAALRQYWGYASFRPLQESIVGSVLAGHDTCVVMPTGGGKSLCYQLPAALQSDKTAVVVSPLIALMQDQVAQLEQIGIPAGLLNSSLPQPAQTEVMRRAREGRYRLLYLSPERLVRPETIAWLREIPIAYFVIDEAHCISQWGHEFRPEYRQLRALRQQFPALPITAFTASATQRVRHDIMEQLGLREPHKFIASFHRANLRYLVRRCEPRTQPELLLRGLRSYPEGNIIVYAPTIKRVEETADFLEDHGIPAVPYHGQMDPATRRRNQERWMADEVRVLVGTIAFGLGINKAAVRAVIHLALPQSLEHYYQEAGRAGRDGLPADCVLLWQKRDMGLLVYFIKQIEDRQEQNRAWDRYRDITGFAESSICRHLQICSHFGENPKWNSCRACDVCGATLPWLAEPVRPERVPRRRRTAAQAAAPRGEARSETRPPARSDRGAAVARQRPLHAEDQPSAAPLDSGLRDYLREWRRTAAQKQGVPAFVVLHDTSLDDLCHVQPTTLAELRRVFGFGEIKTARYGGEVLAALAAYRRGARAAAAPEPKLTPAEETLDLLAQGRTLEEIAQIRGRKLDTVIDRVSELVENGEVEFDPSWVDAQKQAGIEAAAARLGTEKLRPIKDALPPEVTYAEIRLVLARLRRELPRSSEEHPGR
ncbi:MAG TPA: RecQ family ATP-dependent DNA helicase [Candidatus Acidoferrales bacterium]|nr:RecQ family ATP-dependent DNA helicase [Candidatus Acidoferrales bacterium]